MQTGKKVEFMQLLLKPFSVLLIAFLSYMARLWEIVPRTVPSYLLSHYSHELLLPLLCLSPAPIFLCRLSAFCLTAVPSAVGR